MSGQSRRPVWVWIISTFYLFSAAYSLVVGYLVISGRLNPAAFASLGPLDWTISAAILACNVAGAIFLFMLRGLAPYLFLAGLSVSLLQTAWFVLARGLLAGIAGPTLIGLVLGTAISVAVIGYAFHLANKGVLR